MPHRSGVKKTKSGIKAGPVKQRKGAKMTTDGLTDKQRIFVEEYLADFNATRAAEAAGYSNPQVSGARQLQNPKIAAVVEKYMARVQKQYELTREAILEQLAYCALRTGGDFVDDDGRIVQNIKKLPKAAQGAIDGIKQKVRKYYDREGNLAGETVETELKLVSKATALDLAMKHKGLFAAEKHEHLMTQLDWDKMHEPPESGDDGIIDGEVVQRALEHK